MSLNVTKSLSFQNNFLNFMRLSQLHISEESKWTNFQSSRNIFGKIKSYGQSQLT